jgi:MSHA pilin protein MshC
LRDETAAALRYAQKYAIAARRPVCVDFVATALSARVANDAGAANCDAGVVLAGPSNPALSVVGRGNAQYSPVPPRIVFDALGSVPAQTVIAVQNLPATLNIVVEAGTGHVR